MDNTLLVSCNACGEKYELKPIREFPPPAGGGIYSSDKDTCQKCGSLDLAIQFKDGRPAHGRPKPKKK